MVNNENLGFKICIRLFEVIDEQRSGQPNFITTGKNYDTASDMILEDLRISATVVADPIGIPRERVGFIIPKILNMGNLYAKWVSKFLNADQKRAKLVAFKGI